MIDDQAAREWRRMHAVLLEKERLLAHLAVEFAFGRASEEALSAIQKEVHAQRELSDVLFSRAFGVTNCR